MFEMLINLCTNKSLVGEFFREKKTHNRGMLTKNN